MNRINYSPYKFDDSSIVSGSVAMENAMMFDSLNPDELTVEVISTATGKNKLLTVDLEWYTTVDNRGYVVYDGDLRKFTYGDPVYYYYDNVLQGKFYIRSVERLSVDHFRINAFSAVGMWASIQDFGGVYTGQTAGTVIDEIINGGKDYLSGYGSTTTSNGVTFTKNADGSWTVDGTATGSATCVIYVDNSLPTGMTAGTSYWLSIDNGDAPIVARARTTSGAGNRTVEAPPSAPIGIPVGVTSFRVLMNVAQGETVNNQKVTVTITKSPKRNFAYTIDPDVAAVPIYGWLPVASVRDNIQQVLFSIGASLMKNASGNPHFKFLQGLSPTIIGDDRIFIGGQLNYKTPSTNVMVTEHTFYKSNLDVRESLFDNTDGQSGTAQNQLITFDAPHYDLEWNGVSTVGSDNYYYANGNGVLTGKPYTHTTRTFSVPTGIDGEQREAKVEKATLVSPLNSANVAARVSDYQASAEEVACGIVMSNDDIKCGSLISFNDPYGESTNGLISKMNVTMSGKSKADCTIVKGYMPSHFGSNFKSVDVFTADSESLTWTVPNDTSLIRIVLGQGGQAGQNGYNGTSATSDIYDGVVAGEGGSAGSAGSAGKVYYVDITNPTGTITFSIGAAGTPNNGEGSTGGTGGHTTATYSGTTYSSNSGSIPPEGYRNIINGITYSVLGIDGIPGGNGGEGAVGRDNTRKGESVTYGNSTWAGGNTGSYIETNNIDDDRWAYGGAGGGAAYGATGENGHDGFINSSNRYMGGAGGDGGNAKQLAYTPPLGSGGAGGCGGGGGGCPGISLDDRRTSYDGYAYGTDGSGGSFSKGTMGGGGYALVFY